MVLLKNTHSILFLLLYIFYISFIYRKILKQDTFELTLFWYWHNLPQFFQIVLHSRDIVTIHVATHFENICHCFRDTFGLFNTNGGCQAYNLQNDIALKINNQNLIVQLFDNVYDCVPQNIVNYIFLRK